MQLGRQPTRFAPKDQDDTFARAEGRVPEETRGFRREEEGLAEVRQLMLECIPAWPHVQVDVLPIIEASALHLALVQGEAKWLDEVQTGARRETGSAGIAGASSGSRDERERRA